MSRLKELFTLVKWLFASRPSDVCYEDIQIVTMKHFPFRGYRYMAWCGRIVTRLEKEEVLERFLKTEKGKESLMHETGHIIQAVYEHNDNWVRFYWMYFIHWCKHNPLVHPSKAAYYCNRYEVEAYAQQGNPQYWEKYTRKNLKGKYSIKNAKQKFRECGCKVRVWKEYIKTL